PSLNRCQRLVRRAPRATGLSRQREGPREVPCRPQEVDSTGSSRAHCRGGFTNSDACARMDRCGACRPFRPHEEVLGRKPSSFTIAAWHENGTARPFGFPLTHVGQPPTKHFLV